MFCAKEANTEQLSTDLLVDLNWLTCAHNYIVYYCLMEPPMDTTEADPHNTSIRSRHLTAANFACLPATTSRVVVENCTSHEWRKISDQLYKLR